MKVTLGAYMIVKDEERCIDRCLATIIDHVDQLVVVDTGSTDQTLEKLRSWGKLYPHLEIYEHPWVDFATMRNISMSYLKTDWALIFDADEWIPNPDPNTGKDPWLLVTRALVAAGDTCDAFYINVQNILPSKQTLGGDNAKMLRLHPVRPELAWVGAAHNQIQYSILDHPRDGKEPRFGYIEITLLHDGYNMPLEEKRKKYSPRLGLYYSEISRWLKAGNKGREHYYRFQTAVCYHMIGDFPKCVEVAKEVDLESLNEDNRIGLLSTAIGAALSIGDKIAHDWAKELLKLAPREPFAYLQMGLSYYKREMWNDAYTFIAAAMALGKDPNLPKRYLINTPYVSGILGEVLGNLGQSVEALILIDFHLDHFQNPDLRVKKKKLNALLLENLILSFPDDEEAKLEQDEDTNADETPIS